MFRRIAVCSAALALAGTMLAGSTASADDTTAPVCHTKTFMVTPVDPTAEPTTTDITTCDDTFDQASGPYLSVFANTKTKPLALLKNDPSSSEPGAQICRLDSNPDTVNNPYQWGWSALTNGDVTMKLNPWTVGKVTGQYALCTADYVSAPTTFVMVVKKLHEVKAKIKTHVIVVPNKNDAVLHCIVSNWRNAHLFKVPALATKRQKLPAGPKHYHWSCYIDQSLGTAVAGSNKGI